MQWHDRKIISHRFGLALLACNEAYVDQQHSILTHACQREDPHDCDPYILISKPEPKQGDHEAYEGRSLGAAEQELEQFTVGKTMILRSLYIHFGVQKLSAEIE